MSVYTRHVSSSGKLFFGGIPTGGLVRESAKIMVIISLSVAANIDHFAYYRFTRVFFPPKANGGKMKSGPLRQTVWLFK